VFRIFQRSKIIHIFNNFDFERVLPENSNRWRKMLSAKVLENLKSNKFSSDLRSGQPFCHSLLEKEKMSEFFLFWSAWLTPSSIFFPEMFLTENYFGDFVSTLHYRFVELTQANSMTELLFKSLKSFGFYSIKLQK
jgi:hypothetical protein